MRNERIRLGVVGTGLIWSTTHKQAIEKLPVYEVTALCAQSEKSRAAAGADFPKAAVYSDFRQLIASDNVDVVVVCTPIALNGVVTIAALHAGKDVFVEKPVAASTREVDRVIAAERESGRTVTILENLLYTDNWRKLKDILQSGEIGTVAGWDKVTYGFLDTIVDPYGYGRTKWRVAGEFPLGPLFDGGVHELALHAFLFGPVTSVVAHGQSFRQEHGEYDNIQMLMTHQDGALGMFAHSAFLGGSRNTFTIRGTKGLVAIETDQFVIENKLGGNRVMAIETGSFHDNMWADIARTYGSRERPYYSASVARADIATLEAVERSLHLGGEQAVAG